MSEAPREHRYVPAYGVLWLGLCGAAAAFLLAGTPGRAAWTWAQYAVLGAPFVAALGLLVALFYRKIRTSEEWIEVEGLVIRRRLRWDAIEEVRFKGGTHLDHFKQTDKIVLRGLAGRIVAHEAFRGYEALEQRIDAKVTAAGHASVSAARTAWHESLRSWLYLPHREDYPEFWLTIAAMVGAAWVAVRLPEQAVFQALGG
jgi:hypothetical protein